MQIRAHRTIRFTVASLITPQCLRKTFIILNLLLNICGDISYFIKTTKIFAEFWPIYKYKFGLNRLLMTYVTSNQAFSAHQCLFKNQKVDSVHQFTSKSPFLAGNKTDHLRDNPCSLMEQGFFSQYKGVPERL